MAENQYQWTDNPTVSGVSPCNTDVLNDCLMHLKYDSGSSRNIGELVTSLLPQTDAGLHLVDGTLINGNGAYADFVDYIAELYNANPTANYFTTEEEWQTSIVNYGVCGKFVYDSVANTVRLPKATGLIEGTIDLNALGDLVQAGLPNITGNISWLTGVENLAVSGVFSGDLYSYKTGHSSGNATAGGTITFDASNSNSIYGNSNTVQPQTIKGFIYICIATSKKTDVEVNIDNVMTDVNGKADTDLTNITNTAQNLMSRMSMPSDRYVDLTLGASGTEYTSPANGWYVALLTCNRENGNIWFQNISKNGFCSPLVRNAFTGGWFATNIPCQKGDVVVCYYDNIAIVPSDNYFRFYYAVGSESEAQ